MDHCALMHIVCFNTLYTYFSCSFCSAPWQSSLLTGYEQPQCLPSADLPNSDYILTAEHTTSNSLNLPGALLPAQQVYQQPLTFWPPVWNSGFIQDVPLWNGYEWVYSGSVYGGEPAYSVNCENTGNLQHFHRSLKHSKVTALLILASSLTKSTQ